MSARLNLVTGATGLLGSHVVERLRTRGEQVRCLVRPSSDAAFLRALGAEVMSGDLRELTSVQRAVAGADVVYHCAARVGDWGDWRAYQEDTVEATRNLFKACGLAGVGRVLHVSSIAVYGHPRPRLGPFTEDEPRGQNLRLWDHYRRAKIQAEEIAWAHGPNVTVIRPSWIYGPRDRATVPRVVQALVERRVPVIGGGDNTLNIVYAGDVAEGMILAANHPAAAGQAYHLSSAGEATQRQLLDVLTDTLALPRITRHVPFRLAYWGAFLLELYGRALRRATPPAITRYAISLIGRPTQFSIEKARTQLGWQPRVGIQEGLARTLEWLRWEKTAPMQPGRTGM